MLTQAVKYETYNDYVTAYRSKGYSVIPESLYDAIKEQMLVNVGFFWTKCHETIGECESAEEWESKMKQHEWLLEDSHDEDHIKEVGYVAMWNDYWADFV